MNNEQELIRCAQRGDSEAFRQLVEAYQTQVYRLALRMCGESAADDVTQEAFLAAWRALPDFRGDCRFSTWLYRLTTRLSEEHRQVLLLRYMQELDYGEIAAALDVSEGTVKSRINRAKGRLRELLAPGGNLSAAGFVLPSENNDRREQP
mgnify:CR=1 FL=1